VRIHFLGASIMAELTRERVDAEHYVARYAQGGLSDSEQEAFEDFCVLHPEFAEQVGTDRVLIAAMRAIDSARKPRASRPLVYALAAGVVLAVSGLAFWFHQDSGADGALYAAGATLPMSTSAHLASPHRVVLLRDGSVLTLTVPADATALPLKIEPAVTRDATDLHVTLAEEVDGRWNVRGTIEGVRVTPGEEAAVDVTVDLTKLTSAHLRVTLETDDGRTDEFELRIVRNPAT
jgi:hypothetical protein